MARSGAGLLVAAAIVLASRAAGQSAAPLSSGEQSIANFAFATQLGSGIYAVNGRTIQIYRLPLSVTVREETPARWGLKVTFPVTLGFYDFEPVDVLDTGLPEHLDTVSLVPGLEFRILARDNLLLKPFLEAGLAREGSADVEAWVSTFGLRTLATFRAGSFDLDLGNGLLYARVDPDGDVPADAFTAFDTSFQARHGMGLSIGKHELEYGLYASAEVYFDEPNFPLPSANSSDVTGQYEIGATLGTRETVRIWKFKVPRLGVGYRFGPDTSAIRFVIGTPTPVLKR